MALPAIWTVLSSRVCHDQTAAPAQAMSASTIKPDDPAYQVIRDYCRERDAMLLKGDPKALIDFHIKYGLPTTRDEKVAEIELHKCRTAIESMPMAVRSQSKRWLLRHGYQSLDDGEVPT